MFYFATACPFESLFNRSKTIKGLAPFALGFRSKKVEIPCKRGIYINLVFNFRCSLSRRGSKRPFHRPFSRKVFIKQKSMFYFATACPFESLFNRSKKQIGCNYAPYLFFGGDKGTRTLGLCVANASLYQLSHIPSNFQPLYYITIFSFLQQFFAPFIKLLFYFLLFLFISPYKSFAYSSFKLHSSPAPLKLSISFFLIIIGNSLLIDI